MYNKKLFVAGYYDDRIFNIDSFDEPNGFDSKVDTYTLNELLELSFVENVIDIYEEDNQGKEWDDLSFEQKVEQVIRYVKFDEIAGVAYFENESKAEEYKQNVLDNLDDKAKVIEFSHKKQDVYGYFREVYILKTIAA